MFHAPVEPDDGVLADGEGVAGHRGVNLRALDDRLGVDPDHGDVVTAATGPAERLDLYTADTEVRENGEQHALGISSGRIQQGDEALRAVQGLHGVRTVSYTHLT